MVQFILLVNNIETFLKWFYYYTVVLCLVQHADIMVYHSNNTMEFEMFSFPWFLHIHVHKTPFYNTHSPMKNDKDAIFFLQYNKFVNYEI